MFVDIFVLIVVLGSILIAFLRGFIREVLTILGIAGGIIAAYIGGPLFSPIMRGWMGVAGDEDKAEKLFDILPYPLLADALSYGIILIVFVVILSIFSHFLAEFVKNLGLGALDRTLGVVFGFFRGVIVLGLLYLPFFYLAESEQKDEWFGESKTQIYLEVTSAWLDGFIPREIMANAQEGAEKIKNMPATGAILDNMDLLKKLPDNLGSGDGNNHKNKDGYSSEFRGNMDKLFEDNSDKSPDYNE